MQPGSSTEFHPKSYEQCDGGEQPARHRGAHLPRGGEGVTHIEEAGGRCTHLAILLNL